jgi:hypothetical protein
MRSGDFSLISFGLHSEAPITRREEHFSLAKRIGQKVAYALAAFAALGAIWLGL